MQGNDEDRAQDSLFHSRVCRRVRGPHARTHGRDSRSEAGSDAQSDWGLLQERLRSTVNPTETDATAAPKTVGAADSRSRRSHFDRSESILALARVPSRHWLSVAKSRSGIAPHLDFLPRWIGIGIVILACVTEFSLLALVMVRFPNHAAPIFPTGSLARSLPLLTLLAGAASFSVIDMYTCAGDYAEVVLLALVLGGLAAWPLFLCESRGVRRLMIAIEIYGVVSGWVAMQGRFDCNMQRPFKRFYSHKSKSA